MKFLCTPNQIFSVSLFNSKRLLIIGLPALFVVVLFLLELMSGPVSIPFLNVLKILSGSQSSDPVWNVIILESRLPRALTAMIAGSSLALSGLLMQTLFRNPLAGPSVLGISSGASLGVAVLVLSSGGAILSSLPFAGAGIALAAVFGAMIVLLILLVVAERLRDNTSLLIFGIMLGYFTSAAVSILEYKAGNESLRSFVLWSMGSFAEADKGEVLIMTILLIGACLIVGSVIRALDLMLLGDEYASSMGVSVRSTRTAVILAAGILAGGVTAFAGPIAFIGLAVPHIARSVVKSSSHPILFWPLLLIGAFVGLLCDYIARIAEVPLNAVASALGAPVIIYIIVKGSKSKAIV